MEVKGKVKVINPTQEVSASFKKRELVVTTEETYPQHILIEFAQDKTDLLNNYNVGEQVKVSINLRGREWVNPQGETKYFNQIQGWRIEKVQAESPYTHHSNHPTNIPPANQASPKPYKGSEEEHDDVPF